MTTAIGSTCTPGTSRRILEERVEVCVDGRGEHDGGPGLRRYQVVVVELPLVTRGALFTIGSKDVTVDGQVYWLPT